MGVKKFFKPQEWDDDVPVETRGENLAQSVSLKKLKRKRDKINNELQENVQKSSIDYTGNNIENSSSKKSKKKSKSSERPTENNVSEFTKNDIQDNDGETTVSTKKKKEKFKKELQENVERSVTEYTGNNIENSKKSKKKKSQSSERSAESNFSEFTNGNIRDNENETALSTKKNNKKDKSINIQTEETGLESENKKDKSRKKYSQNNSQNGETSQNNSKVKNKLERESSVTNENKAEEKKIKKISQDNDSAVGKKNVNSSVSQNIKKKKKMDSEITDANNSIMNSDKKAKKRKADPIETIPKKSKKINGNNEKQTLTKNAMKKLKRKMSKTNQQTLTLKEDSKNALSFNNEQECPKKEEQNSQEVSKKTLLNRKRRAKKKPQIDVDKSTNKDQKKDQNATENNREKNKQNLNLKSKNQTDKPKTELKGIMKKSKEKEIKKFKELLKKVVVSDNDKNDKIDNAQMLVKLNNEPENKPVKHQPQSLRERMMEKLKGARFRYLNEQMYKKVSQDTNKMFKEDPTSFKAYHDGYKQQVQKWPLNPLDIIISDISKMSKNHVIADLGCGEGLLAKSVQQKVHSFDLVSLNPSVTACDMAHTPLLIGQCDVVVFCLSLMGTNLKDYILEANRILKIGGMLKIAEVESRFENVDIFINDIKKYGFSLIKKDLNNQLFYFMDFKKENDVKKRNKVPELTLNPCLYKKR